MAEWEELTTEALRHREEMEGKRHRRRKCQPHARIESIRSARGKSPGFLCGSAALRDNK
jgi:hypothetical protein